MPYQVLTWCAPVCLDGCAVQLDDVVHIRAQQPAKPRKPGSSANMADGASCVSDADPAAASKLGIHLSFNKDSRDGQAEAQCGEYLPAYYVAVEHASKNVLLVVRGTSAMRDLVTDLCGHTTRFLGGAWLHTVTHS